MTFPAGRYYVGDLCYVIRNENWNEVCNVVIDGNDLLEGEFALADGRRFAMYNTAYGDGTYRDAQGRSYSVDAGSIGCIRIEDIPDLDDESLFIDGGQVIEFPREFHTSRTGGTIYFGDVEIQTGDSDYDDEGDDYYEGDDDNALEEEF